MEIERKFLVREFPNLSNAKYKDIEQAYLVVNEECEKRIRKVGDKYFTTIKKGSGLQREEIEYAISKEKYLSLLQQHIGNIIEKKRFLIPLSNKLTAELDVYSGSLKGLKTVEVEFSSIEEANSFIPPDWFGKDITSNKKYKNSSLAINGLSLDVECF